MDDRSGSPTSKSSDLLDLEERRARLEHSATQCVELLATHIGQSGNGLVPTRIPSETAQLRAQVTAYARSLKAFGSPPEAVVREIKELVMSATRRNEDYAALIAWVVRWSIDAYFPAD